MQDEYDILTEASQIAHQADDHLARLRAEYNAIAQEWQYDLLWNLGTMLLMVTQDLSVEEAGIQAYRLLTECEDPTDTDDETPSDGQ